MVLCASDPVARWDACQQLVSETIFAFAQDATSVLPETMMTLFSGLLEQAQKEPALIAEMLELPSFETLAQQRDRIDVDALLSARTNIRKLLASAFASDWRALFEMLSNPAYCYEQQQVERGVCREYVCLIWPACRIRM